MRLIWWLSARDRSRIISPYTSRSSTLCITQGEAWSKMIQCSCVLGSVPWGNQHTAVVGLVVFCSALSTEKPLSSSTNTGPATCLCDSGHGCQLPAAGLNLLPPELSSFCPPVHIFTEG